MWDKLIHSINSFDYTNWGSRDGCTHDFVSPVLSPELEGLILRKDLENAWFLAARSATNVAAVGALRPMSLDVVLYLGSSALDWCLYTVRIWSTVGLGTSTVFLFALIVSAAALFIRSSRRFFKNSVLVIILCSSLFGFATLPPISSDVRLYKNAKVPSFTYA